MYLHIVAKSQVVLDAAVDEVNKLINQDLAPLIEDRTLIARARATGAPLPPQLAQQRPKWPEEKLFIDLEPMRNFNIRAKVVGPGVSIDCRGTPSLWQTNNTGHVREVYPGGDGCTSADQGTRVWLHGERYGSRVG